MSAGKKAVKRKRKKNEPKADFKDKMSEILELPKEIVLNVPKLTMLGNRNMVIENYKGVIEYDSTRIRLNTSLGVMKIIGEGLVIKEITSEDIIVEGEIGTLEFIK